MLPLLSPVPLSPPPESPRPGSSWLPLGLLMGVAVILRGGIPVEGVLDTDATDYALAVLRFDVMDLQPHPPGFIGYVAFLKGLSALLPFLTPLEVGRWGSLLCSVGTLPAAAWAVGRWTGTGPTDTRSLAAASLIAFHPLLWYSGIDGQSHAAEALAVLLLWGSAPLRDASSLSLVRWAILAGLLGSLRPTVPLLALPAALPSLLAASWRGRFQALLGGGLAISLWWGGLVHLAGGRDLWNRLMEAQVTEWFLANSSVFGSRATGASILGNFQASLVGLVLAAFPFLVWRGEGGMPRNRLLLAVPVVNFTWASLLLCAEPGYFAGTAAVACLTPLTWQTGSLPRLRTLLVGLAGMALFLIGPVSVSPSRSGEILLPTLPRILENEHGQRAYRLLACAAASHHPSLLVTDNLVTTHTRVLSLQCPELQIALLALHPPMRPSLDALMVYQRDGLLTLPSPVPLEPGPPSSAPLDPPVDRVILAPDASSTFKRSVQSQALCPSLPDDGHSSFQVWEASCLPSLTLGSHRLLPAGLHGGISP